MTPKLMSQRPLRMASAGMMVCIGRDRKSTRLNSSHTVIYTLSLHDALPIYLGVTHRLEMRAHDPKAHVAAAVAHGERRNDGVHRPRSEEHTSELQSHRDLHSFPTRRSSDLSGCDPSAGNASP